MALKRASLTLDLARLIEAQREALDTRQSEIAEAKALLLAFKSRIGRGEPVDAATFCSLIKYERGQPPV